MPALASLALLLSACASPPGAAGEPGAGSDAAQAASAPVNPAEEPPASAASAPARAGAPAPAPQEPLVVLGPAPREADWAGLSAGDLEPLGEVTEEWLVIEGRNKGARFERRRTPTMAFGASVSDRWGDWQTAYLRPDLDGGVSMPAVTSHRDRATTLFDPPLGVAPPRLAPGTAWEQSSAMTVVNEEKISQIRNRGRGERRIEIVGGERIRTLLGEFDAVRVRTSFTATLDLAKASDTVEQLIVPGLGVVAEDRTERITAIGFVNRTQRTVIVRVR